MNAREVEVADRQQVLRIDARAVRRAVAHVLGQEGIATYRISIAFVDDPAIHELNRRYLQHDYPTDVLSFLWDHVGDHLEGEIIISTETALRCAEEEDGSVWKETLWYLVHGLLHLVGFDDHSKKKRAQMRAREQEHLTALDQLVARRSPS